MKNIWFNISSNLKNVPGKKFEEKAIVIECDDWGGQRMPSLSAYNNLLKLGIVVNDGRYNQFDSLETPEDIESLFNILTTFTDSSGNHPIFTAFTNLANPDFTKIKEHKFEKYFIKELDDSFKDMGTYSDMMKLYSYGKKIKIFIPEYHGRDHIASAYWLNELKRGNKDVIAGFNEGFVFVKTPTLPLLVQQFRPEYYIFNADSLSEFEFTLKDGVRIFNKVFGSHPKSFVPPNGIFHPSLEKVLYNSGLRYLNTVAFPNKLEGKNSSDLFLRSFGQNSKYGLKYYLRNVVFEPCSIHYRNIDNTLLQIKAAFRWKKPAVISTHRVNYVGSLCQSNRERGLNELSSLLKNILRYWPDVKFYSSSELYDKMLNNNL